MWTYEMDPSLIGSWEAIRSDIPDYAPHREWLHFREDGLHTIESLHPGQDLTSAKIEFVLEEAHGAFHLLPTKLRPDGSRQQGWRISIVRTGSDEIAVTGHTWARFDVALPAGRMAVVQHVPNGEGEDFRDAETEEHLCGDQGSIARTQTTHVSEENSLFVRGERT